MPKKKTQEEYVAEVAMKNSNINVLEEYQGIDIKILHKCKICGYEWNISPKHVLRNQGCPICAGHKVGPPPEYKNSIWSSKYRERAEYYGLTASQMQSISPHSKKIININCPTCGKSKNILIYNLLKQGLGCTKCSDGISYPEKFMMSILDQLHLDYKTQYSPNWAGGKRYDFYLENYNCIIETHGAQHYERGFYSCGGMTLEEERENDQVKKDIAKQNGILYYIIVDCRENTIEWIKSNVMNSDMPMILNFIEDDIDWKKCSIHALHSRLKEASDLWTKGLTTTLIATTMKVGITTVQRWLKQAAACELCDYTPQKGRERARTDEWKNRISNTHKGMPSSNKNMHKIYCVELNTFFECASDIKKAMNLPTARILKCCKNKRCTCGRYHWRYADDIENDTTTIKPLSTNNSSGFIGVYWSKKDQSWYSQITVNRKRIHLGYTSTKEEAIIQRLRAELKYFGLDFAPQRHLFKEYGIINS